MPVLRVRVRLRASPRRPVVQPLRARRRRAVPVRGALRGRGLRLVRAVQPRQDALQALAAREVVCCGGEARVAAGVEEGCAGCRARARARARVLGPGLGGGACEGVEGVERVAEEVGVGFVGGVGGGGGVGVGVEG